KAFDELYINDGLHRLKDMQRGTLNGSKTAITNDTFEQCWTLDATGNWPGFREDTDGDKSWDLVQSRVSDPINEIISILNSVGPVWAQPEFDRSGNAITVQQPQDLSDSYSCVYDAWNRLIGVFDEESPVSAYSYDGAKRRIVQKTYE